MIDRYSKDHHIGDQPIRVLTNSTLHKFENTNPEFLNLSLEIIERLDLQKGITYYVNNEPVFKQIDGYYQTPYAYSDKIVIHETFSSYVWCVTYAILTLYEESFSKPVNNYFSGYERFKIHAHRITNAIDILDYAKYILVDFKEWDKNRLPNPELYPEEEQEWIEKINGVYVYTMNFILCHEFVHIEKEHIKQRSNDFSLSKFLEREADARSIELILSGLNAETRATGYAGMLVGMCSLIFFSPEITGGDSHPDTDIRIDDLMTKLNPSEDSALWGIACVAFKQWEIQFGKKFNWPKSVNSPKEMYYIIKKEIEMTK
jgi:hypothetical protein